MKASRLVYDRCRCCNDVVALTEMQARLWESQGQRVRCSYCRMRCTYGVTCAKEPTSHMHEHEWFDVTTFDNGHKIEERCKFCNAKRTRPAPEPTLRSGMKIKNGNLTRTS